MSFTQQLSFKVLKRARWRSISRSSALANACTRVFRFGFILSTVLGNATGYRTLRKYAERDSEIECTWAPVKHFFAPGERDPVALVPRPLYWRAVAINQAWPVLSRMHQFDAVMIHQWEALSLATLRSLVRSRPPVFAAQDNPPIVDPDNYPLYPAYLRKPQWRRSIRLTAERWMTRHTQYFIPFSQWQADVLVKGCGIAAERVLPIHVGMDLELWPSVARDTATKSGPIRLLFVGGDFERKGGPLLLELFASRMFPRMTLDLVTSTPPPTVPEGVTVHNDVVPGDGRIQRLYANADIFLLPTMADFTPWACLEAMACGCPVIASRVGSIPDIGRNDHNGLLVAPGDVAGIREAIETLASDPVKRAAMGAEGRRIIESDFNAARNVKRILNVMKDVVCAKTPTSHNAR